MNLFDNLKISHVTNCYERCCVFGNDIENRLKRFFDVLKISFSGLADINFSNLLSIYYRSVRLQT